MSEVEDDIKKVLARNKHELNTALIKPIHKITRLVRMDCTALLVDLVVARRSIS